MLLATLVALAGSGGGRAAGDRGVPGADPLHTDVVTISATPVGEAVPGAFVGLSLEYPTVFSAELPAGVSSYGAYPLPWHPAG